MGEGGAQINLSSHMEGGAKITWSVAGMKADEVIDPDAEDHTEWVQSELDRILENPLTKKMQQEMDKHSRDYEILMTQYNQVHLSQLELKDDQDAGETRFQKLKEQNEKLLKEMESMAAEHEDLVQRVNDNQSSSLEEHKRIATLERENEKLKNQHDIELKEMSLMEEQIAEMTEKNMEIEAENKSLKEEVAQIALLVQQKEALNSRVTDLQQQIEAMKRNFHNAKKAEEEANAKRDEVETQFLQMKSEAEGSLSARQKSQSRIADLKAEIDRLRHENDELRARSVVNQPRSNVDSGADKNKEIAMLKHEMEESKAEFEEVIARKDRMLNEVKDALKSLGLKLGNLDSKMAIPKLKALLNILTKQVEQYKGRQKELEHLVKARTTELAYYKEHFGDASHRHWPGHNTKKDTNIGGGAFSE